MEMRRLEKISLIFDFMLERYPKPASRIVQPQSARLRAPSRQV
jgi:hypothetical protein